MKGVILAGGKGTRLMPLTKATNKHLLPVGLEPMIFHPIRQLAEAGIRDILVVTSTDHMGDVVRCLGSGAMFDVDLTYRVQEEAGGIAEALMLARGFAAGEPICVILGDNIFQYTIAPYAENYRKQPSGARVLLKRVEDPRSYGVAALDERHVLEIQEKPEDPPSDYAVVGLYFYDQHVFDHISKIKPSARGELEITGVNNRYIEAGQLEYDIVHGGWTDAGKPKSYLEANEMMFGQENAILKWNLFNKRG
jgi:glucose-1-phosphate thymidylyltransferase